MYRVTMRRTWSSTTRARAPSVVLTLFTALVLSPFRWVGGPSHATSGGWVAAATAGIGSDDRWDPTAMDGGAAGAGEDVAVRWDGEVGGGEDEDDLGDAADATSDLGGDVRREEGRSGGWTAAASGVMDGPGGAERGAERGAASSHAWLSSTTCRAVGAPKTSFGDVVRRQSSVDDVRHCHTDAAQLSPPETHAAGVHQTSVGTQPPGTVGASRAAGEADAPTPGATGAGPGVGAGTGAGTSREPPSPAKKKEKDPKEAKHEKQKMDVPSLRAFKSDLEAKVTSIRDAKEAAKKSAEKAQKTAARPIPLNGAARTEEGTAAAEGGLGGGLANERTSGAAGVTSSVTPTGGALNARAAAEGCGGSGSGCVDGAATTADATSDGIPADVASLRGASSEQHPEATSGSSTPTAAPDDPSPEAAARVGDHGRGHDGWDEDYEETGGEAAAGAAAKVAESTPPPKPNPTPTASAVASAPEAAVATATAASLGSATSDGAPADVAAAEASAVAEATDAAAVNGDVNAETAAAAAETAAPSVEGNAVERNRPDGDVKDDTDLEEEEEEEEDVSDAVILPAAAEVADAFRGQYNYAAAANGAKVVSSNGEAKSPGAALKEDMDSYYLTPCNAKSGKWLTVELSEEAAVTAVVLANFEFHSSGVREFEIWGSAAGNFNKKEEWSRLARCRADSGREQQTFVLPRGVWSKFVQIRMTGHYGSFHFCTVSLFRVHGKDAKQTLKEEMEAINMEVQEVEEILRDADEEAAAVAAAEGEEAAGRDDEDTEAIAAAVDEAEEGAAPPSQPEAGNLAAPDTGSTAPADGPPDGSSDDVGDGANVGSGETRDEAGRRAADAESSRDRSPPSNERRPQPEGIADVAEAAAAAADNPEGHPTAREVEASSSSLSASASRAESGAVSAESEPPPSPLPGDRSPRQTTTGAAAEEGSSVRANAVEGVEAPAGAGGDLGAAHSGAGAAADAAAATETERTGASSASTNGGGGSGGGASVGTDAAKGIAGGDSTEPLSTSAGGDDRAEILEDREAAARGDKADAAAAGAAAGDDAGGDGNGNDVGKKPSWAATVVKGWVNKAKEVVGLDRANGEGSEEPSAAAEATPNGDSPPTAAATAQPASPHGATVDFAPAPPPAAANGASAPALKVTAASEEAAEAIAADARAGSRRTSTAASSFSSSSPSSPENADGAKGADEPPLAAADKTTDNGEKKTSATSDRVAEKERERQDKEPKPKEKSAPSSAEKGVEKTPPEKVAESAKESQPPRENKPVHGHGGSGHAPALSSKPAGGSDNVFSLMAKKIKALELNQSMLDRYIEALNSRYADRFDDLAGDVSDLEDALTNSTAAVASAERTAAAAAAAAEAACDAAVAAAAATHERELRDVRGEMAAAAAAWRAYFGLTLGVVAGLLALIAVGTAGQAAVAAGMGGGGGIMAARVLMLAAIAAAAMAFVVAIVAAWMLLAGEGTLANLRALVDAVKRTVRVVVEWGNGKMAANAARPGVGSLPRGAE